MHLIMGQTIRVLTGGEDLLFGLNERQARNQFMSAMRYEILSRLRRCFQMEL